MEACFLTSSSLPKTLEFSPIRFKSTQFRPKRYISCQLGSSQDDEKPSINADWRSFRAKLVAGEQVSRPDNPLPNANPSILIGKKWAHTIHEPEKGCLLVASEKLDGVHIFERTVVLIISTGPVGPTGIILNRPSLMSIKEMKSTALDVAGLFSDRPLFFGGPLEEGLFLVSDDNHNGVFEEVMKGLYFGTKESVGCAAEMVKRDVIKVEDFRFFDGYCGWEKQQLKSEIRAGYWSVAACSPTVIELANVGSVGLWEEVVGLMGSKKVW